MCPAGHNTGHKAGALPSSMSFLPVPSPVPSEPDLGSRLPLTKMHICEFLLGFLVKQTACPLFTAFCP